LHPFAFHELEDCLQIKRVLVVAGGLFLVDEDGRLLKTWPLSGLSISQSIGTSPCLSNRSSAIRDMRRNSASSDTSVIVVGRSESRLDR
jgi:hypothetical protein